MAEYGGMEPHSSLYSMESIECHFDSVETPLLVQLYRPLIVRSVKADEIVHYLDSVISTREREEIIEVQKQKGSTSAMDDLLNLIDSSENDKKWSIFAEIIDKQGYQYVSKALKGEKVLRDAYQKYKKILIQNKMHLINRLNPEELLDLLENEERIIDPIDREHIQAEQNNKGAMAATIVLLDRIWRRKEFWYSSFLNVLLKKGYSYIVERIDHAFFIDWENKIKEIKSASESRQTCVAETPAPIIKDSKPVQCVSDDGGYIFPVSTPKPSHKMFSSDLHSENSISSDFGPRPDPNELFSEELDSETVLYKRRELQDSENTCAKSIGNAPNTDDQETDLKKTCPTVSEEKASNMSMDDEDVVSESFEERKYQTELAKPAVQGQNCIIIAPTGSGKTIVAVKIIKHHLEPNRQHRVKRIAFVVDKNNLANQQSEVIKRFVTCRLKVVSGDSMREEEFTDLYTLLPRFDVFVMTAQMLINAMDKGDFTISSFTLIIFDECHHCYGGHSFYKAMIPYHDKKQECKEQHSLPQIVGFTASIGIGKAKSREQAIEHIMTMMANLDADELVSVKENIAELAIKMNSPDQYIEEVPIRKVDEFGATIRALMIKTEKSLKEAEDQIEDKNALDPPDAKGNEEYIQWLQNNLLKAVAKANDSNLSSSLYTVRKYLEIYNQGLIINSDARACDALKYITEKIEELPHKINTDLEKRAKALFENEKANLENSSADGQRSEENPLLLRLKQILIERYQENNNMRGIVFVRTRPLAEIIAGWMNETKDLKQIKAKKYTGAGAQTKEGGTTKSKQVKALELFEKGDNKVIVATSIAEEGIDIKKCNLVVRYNYAGNLISQTQAKGRGRADDSRFYILASEENSVAERERTISFKDPMMKEAMEIVQNEIQIDNDKFQQKKHELQREAKRREALVHNQGARETSQGHCVLRCLKCNEYLCLSSEIKKISGSQYACVSNDLKSHVICKKSEYIKFQDKDIKVGLGKMMCIKCRENLGTFGLHKEIYFPLLNIKVIKIEDDLKKGDNLKKWKKVEELYFTPSPLSEEDLERIAKAGKLVDLD